MSEKILFFICGIAAFIILWAVLDDWFYTIKTNYIHRKGRILIEAIYLYNINKIKNHHFKYSDLFDYKKMDYRKAIEKAPFYYWGYRNFLSKEDFEKVKPFIPQAKKGLRKQ